MYGLILILGLAFSGSSYGSTDLSRNPVYAHLIRLNPKLDKEYAMDLSNKIASLSKQYGVDPRVVVAIMKQESSLNPDNHRTAVGLDSYGNVVQVVTDVGLMQINAASVRAYNLSAFLLMTNADYQIVAGFKILADKLKQCAKQYPDTAYACFHSSTPKYHHAYVAAVRRWL